MGHEKIKPGHAGDVSRHRYSAEWSLDENGQ